MKVGDKIGIQQLWDHFSITVTQMIKDRMRRDELDMAALQRYAACDHIVGFYGGYEDNTNKERLSDGGEIGDYKCKYCPDCGAKLEGEDLAYLKSVKFPLQK